MDTKSSNESFKIEINESGKHNNINININNIHTNYENEDRPESNSHNNIFQTTTEHEATMTVENCSERYVENTIVKFELNDFQKIDETRNFCSSDINCETLIFEKIPKAETTIIGADDDQSSHAGVGYEYDGHYNNTESGSDPEPDRDPFADIDCDSRFSRQLPSPSNNSNDSSTTQVQTINAADVSDSSNLLSSVKIDGPIIISNTSKHELQGDTSDAKLQCGMCLRMQSSESQLQANLKICAGPHNTRGRFCVLCNKLFCSPRKYRDHALRKHGIKEPPLNRFSSKCQFCSRSFATKKSLVAHMASHPDQKITSSNEDGLKKAKPFKCPECPSAYETNTRLKYHARSHKNEREFKCPLPTCNKAFNYKNLLKDHVRRAHSEEKPFRCPEPNCDKTFTTKNMLTKHRTSHSVDRPFPCPHPGCSRTFKHKYYIKKHVTFHTGEYHLWHRKKRPFKCEECERAFCKNWELLSHIKTHAIEKSFQCPEPNCKSTLKTKGSLKRHLATIHIQNDLLSFECPEPNCDKKFKFKKCVEAHLKTHTRPYKCTEPGCSAAFAIRRYLFSHVDSMHKNYREKNGELSADILENIISKI